MKITLTFPLVLLLSACWAAAPPCITPEGTYFLGLNAVDSTCPVEYTEWIDERADYLNVEVRPDTLCGSIEKVWRQRGPDDCMVELSILIYTNEEGAYNPTAYAEITCETTQCIVVLE